MKKLFKKSRLKEVLPVNGLGNPYYYHAQIGSTNDEATSLALHGAPHGTLVIAEYQRKGRGQRGRTWSMMSGKGISFSLVLRPGNIEATNLRSLNALGALAVIESLKGYGLDPQMKWPNDVLLAGKKVAGILAECFWDGDVFNFAVLGVGINFLSKCVPEQLPLDYPAISVMDIYAGTIDPHMILNKILSRISIWYLKLDSPDLWITCQSNLAYLGEKVVVDAGERRMMGTLLGISEDGGLKLSVSPEKSITTSYNISSLRPFLDSGETRNPNDALLLI